MRSVKVEYIENERAETVIDDSASGTTQSAWQPQQLTGARSYLHGKSIGDTTWVGQTAARNLTHVQAPWLYQAGNTCQQHYRITIIDMQGKHTVLQQPTFMPSNAKQLYRQVIGNQIFMQFVICRLG